MSLSLFKRNKTGPYYARGSIAGQRIYESTGLDKKSDAQAWANRRESQILQRHALGEKATLTFAEAAQEYLLSGGEGRFLAPILHYFGPDARVAEIDNGTLLKAAARLYPTAAPATINRQLIGPVSAVINQAAENGRADPRKFRRHKARGARTRWLSPQEMDRILDAAAPHLVPVLALMIGTGCRTGEALGAQVQNWHAATGEIWLPETKNGHPRMVQMPARARDLILAAGVPADGTLFRTPKGQPYVARESGGGQIQRAFNQARDRAGLGPDVTPHVLRHTWATWFYTSTRDYGRMLDLGGWRTTSTAERYRKIAPADLGDKVLAAGWDFTRLGTQLPNPEEKRAGIRLVQ